MTTLVESIVPARFSALDRRDDFPNESDARYAASPLPVSEPCVQRLDDESVGTVVDSPRRGNAQDEDERVPGQEHFGTSEDILRWPVFERRYDRRRIEALIFDPTLPCNDLSGSPVSPRVADDSGRDRFQDPRQNSGIGPGVREEDVPHLIESFLLNVHVKNPICDPGYLRNLGRTVMEDGFDWRAPSCLVVSSVPFLVGLS